VKAKAKVKAEMKAEMKGNVEAEMKDKKRERAGLQSIDIVGTGDEHAGPNPVQETVDDKENVGSEKCPLNMLAGAVSVSHVTAPASHIKQPTKSASKMGPHAGAARGPLQLCDEIFDSDDDDFI
jgi:hypothetical protein